MEKKKIYRLGEVATLLSLGEKKVRLMLKTGVIPCVHQGRLLCVLAEDLDNYVDSLRPGPAKK